jgi:hypothetical protein
MLNGCVEVNNVTDTLDRGPAAESSFTPTPIHVRFPEIFEIFSFLPFLHPHYFQQRFNSIQFFKTNSTFQTLSTASALFFLN